MYNTLSRFLRWNTKKATKKNIIFSSSYIYCLICIVEKGKGDERGRGGREEGGGRIITIVR
jgi:hypothetical protein